MATAIQSPLAQGQAAALKVDLQDPFLCNSKNSSAFFKEKTLVHYPQVAQQRESSFLPCEEPESDSIGICQYPEVTLCSEKWYPWQGGSAPNSPSLNSNLRYQYQVSSATQDQLSDTDGYGPIQAWVKHPGPQNRKRLQHSSRVGPASQPSDLIAAGNNNATWLPDNSSLHDAGIVGGQQTPRQPRVIDAQIDPGLKFHKSYPAGPSSIQHQTRATSQYSTLGLNQTLIPHDAMGNASLPRSVQGQCLRTEWSSLGNGQEADEALELQSSRLSPDTPHRSPVDASFGYSARPTFMTSATPSSSSSGRDQMTPKMLRKSNYMPPKNHKAGSAEKHYLDTIDGQLYHKMDKETEWHLAIQHADAWDNLLSESDSKSYYRIAQKEGISPGDRTAPVPGHEEWGPNRNDRPEELFMLHRTKEVYDRAYKPSRLLLGDRRVIDRDGRWMKHWDDVPVTFSSLIPGWYLEALIRRNHELTMIDIRARFMDSFLFFDHKTKKVVTQTAWGSTALTNRMMRFRDETFNLTWGNAKDKTDDREDFFFSLLPQECIEADSTQKHRDMDPKEKTALRKYLRNAGEKTKMDRINAGIAASRHSTAVSEKANDGTDDGSSNMNQPPMVDDFLTDYEPGYLNPVERDEAPPPVSSEGDGMSKNRSCKKRPRVENDDDYKVGSRAKGVRDTGKIMAPVMMPANPQPVTKRIRHARLGGSLRKKTTP